MVVINMEVKIKIGDEMIDAKIVMMNGDMIVSPKVVKFEPENGDIVTTENGIHIFLCKDYIGKGNIYAYIGYNFNMRSWFREGKWVVSRYATEEEKKEFFDKLAEEGYEFDFEKKELVKLKWKPKVGDTYFRPDFNRCRFMCYEGRLQYDTMRYIKDRIENGWCFKTKEECEQFCIRLNDAINSVKP